MPERELRRTERLFRHPKVGKKRGLSSQLQGPKRRRKRTQANGTTATGPRHGAKGAKTGTGRTRIGTTKTRRTAVGTRKTAMATTRGRVGRGMAMVPAVQGVVMAMVPAVLRGVVAVVPVVVVVVPVHQAVAVVPPVVIAVRPNAVENSTRRSSSASAYWTSARGMRPGAEAAGRWCVQPPSWALAAAATASGVKPKWRVTSLRGAEAPKERMARMAPVGPA
jgi:hypothetical protein